MKLLVFVSVLAFLTYNVLADHCCDQICGCSVGQTTDCLPQADPSVCVFIGDICRFDGGGDFSNHCMCEQFHKKKFCLEPHGKPVNIRTLSESEADGVYSMLRLAAKAVMIGTGY